MTTIEGTLARVFSPTRHDKHPKSIGRLNASTWGAEFEEVLLGARQAPESWAMDPDWQAARQFLVRHCLDALGNRR